MGWRTTFGTLAAGDQSLSLFDQMFNDVGLLTVIPCNATGTNSIALTPRSNTATQSAYANYQLYSFVAANTSSGAVTANVASLGSLNVYLSNGSTQANTGDIQSGVLYIVVYDSALNSGGGGLQIVAPFVPPASSTPPTNPNALRNSGLTDWFGGTSGTVPTSAGVTSWTAEGVFAVAAGATLPWAQQASDLTNPQSFYSVKFTGAASNTDLKVRFVLESYTAIRLAGKTVTFQIPVLNNTGGTITPTLATAFPTAQDNWASTTTDLSATNLQSITNGSTAVLAYTLSVSASAKNGYEFIVDFGALSTNAKTIEIGGGFDARATPGVATGLNASPPAPFILDAAQAALWDMRFFEQTYNNNVPATTATDVGHQSFFPASTGTADWYSPSFKSMKRATPTVTLYSPVTGTPGKIADVSTSADVSATADNIGQNGFSINFNAATNVYTVQWTADARIAGG